LKDSQQNARNQKKIGNPCKDMTPDWTSSSVLIVEELEEKEEKE
jgi:hypothetical protein